MAVVVDALELTIDASGVGAIIKGAASGIAEKLRALPRQTEWDGSQWVSAEEIDALIKKLDTIP